VNAPTAVGLAGGQAGDRGQAAEWAAAVAAGLLAWGLAVAAWGPGRTPAVALVLPVLWSLAPTRKAAVAVGFGYDSWGPTIVTALLPGLAGAIVLGLTWTRTGSPWKLALATVAMLALLLVPPMAAVLPGHPIVAAGFLLPRWGWMGVAAVFLFSPLAVVAVRVWARRRWPQARWLGPVAIAALAGAAYLSGQVPNPENGRLAGRVGAINTEWGKRPARIEEEVARIGKIGDAAQRLAGGDDGLDTVIFPESSIGSYDPSLFPVLDLEVLSRIRRTGQTVVIGADVMAGPKTVLNSALILRPDGTASSIAARQTPPLAAWRPWSSELHNPANWLGQSTAPVGGGVTARFMFGYEEYLAGLHLLSEAREEHQLVIAMANLWSTANPVANAVQSAHTEGMALLFGRRWVRSVNLPAAAKTGPS
jgi:hypothetical protein